MKRFLLLYLLIMIALFSSSPNLTVGDPTSWIERPVYASKVDMVIFFNSDSEFYEPYSLFTDRTVPNRKIGHIIVYACLALLFFANFQHFRLPFRFLFAWVLTTLVGFCDEINQYFIVGRDGRIMDVALNSVAALVILITLALLIIKKRRQLSPKSDLKL
jgi:VanZ family protein